MAEKHGGHGHTHHVRQIHHHLRALSKMAGGSKEHEGRKRPEHRKEETKRMEKRR